MGNGEEPLDVAKAGVACTVEDEAKLEDKGRTDHKGKMEDEDILKGKGRPERETKNRRKPREPGNARE